MANINKLLKNGEKHLQPNEKVLAIVMGAYEGKLMGKTALRTGVFIATDTRIFFYAKRLFGFDIESYPFSNISSFDRSKGMMGNSISFFASGNKVSMKWIKTNNLDVFMDVVQSHMGKKTDPTPTVTATIDVAEQIKNLSALKDSGILTEEEFAAKKKQMLGI